MKITGKITLLILCLIFVLISATGCAGEKDIGTVTESTSSALSEETTENSADKTEKSADKTPDEASQTDKEDIQEDSTSSEPESEPLFLDIYTLDSPALEASILLAMDGDFSLLDYDTSFHLEKAGSFTDTEGRKRILYTVFFSGEAMALVSDASPDDGSVLFNSVTDEKYPYTLYECFNSTKGWVIDRESPTVPEDFVSAE